METIDDFNGDYRFLSNFYFPAALRYDGRMYTSSEAAYQSMKTESSVLRNIFSRLYPADAKQVGHSIQLRPDWDKVKVRIMYEVVRAKFAQNPRLADMLHNTNNAVLIERNTWGDNFWGDDINDPVPGQNMLGLILMDVRDGTKKAEAADYLYRRIKP